MDINFSQEQLVFLVAIGRLVVVKGNIDALVAEMRKSLEQEQIDEMRVCVITEEVII